LALAAANTQKPPNVLCGLLAPELRQGQSLSFWVELRAQSPATSQNLYAVVTWTDAAGVRSERSVALGEATVRPWCKKLLAALRDVLKDFALPLVLLVLGWLYQIWDKKREEQRQDAEKQRDLVRQAEDRKRAQLAETWNRMLGESHRLNTEHYIHLGGAVYGLLLFAEKCREELRKQEDQRNQAKLEADGLMQFYYLIRFERRYRHMMETACGFYFKSLVGERLVQECLNLFMAQYTEHWDVARLANLVAAARLTDLNESYDSLMKKLKGEGPVPDHLKRDEFKGIFEQARADFQIWQNGAGYEKGLRYLKTFFCLLSYEMNRPYEYWYGQKEEMHPDPEILQTLEEIAVEAEKDPTTGNFKSKLRSYLSEATAVSSNGA